MASTDAPEFEITGIAVIAKHLSGVWDMPDSNELRRLGNRLLQAARQKKRSEDKHCADLSILMAGLSREDFVKEMNRESQPQPYYWDVIRAEARRRGLEFLPPRWPVSPLGDPDIPF